MPSAFPPLAELLPHRPPMLLLDELVAAGDSSVTCRVTLRDDSPFVRDGKAPALVALEYFAQAVAALFAYKSFGTGAPPFRGVLLGARELELSAPNLSVGDTLEVLCREHWSSGPVAHYQCALSRAHERLAAGAITVLRGDAGALDPSEAP